MWWLLVHPTAFPATLNVCSTCTYTTVGSAVGAASPGDTISIASGVYDETVGVKLEGDIRIRGAGSDVTVLRASAHPLLTLGYDTPDSGLEANVTVSGLTFSGAGLTFTRSKVTISDVRVEDAPGHGISASRAAVTVTGAAFVGNAVGIGVGNDFTVDTLSVSDSIFTENTSGAIQGTAIVSVRGSIFEDNASASYGGAITVWRYSVDLDGNTFSGNSGDAGAIYAVGDLTMAGNRLCGNEGATGGAVFVMGGGSTAEVSGNTFIDNHASDAGGDVYLASVSDASLIGNIFVGGYSPVGGSVWSDGSLSFDDNVVAYASEYAVYGAGGVSSITDNDFWEVAPAPVGGTFPDPDGSNLALDPMFTYYVEGGCEELDVYTRRWYPDGDGDGHGVPEGALYGPTAPAGHSAYSNDCDDTDAALHPGQLEYCDGVDSNCDDVIDNFAQDAATWYRDADHDGFQGYAYRRECEQPTGWEPASDTSDCDDDDSEVYPGAAEVCNDGVDQDCDGTDSHRASWRPDADGDGFQGEEVVRDCAPPDGWDVDAGPPYDCDDGDPQTHPGAEEDPTDSIDRNCDGQVVLTSEEPAEAAEAVDGACGGCATGATPRWSMVVLAAAALGRRRRAGRR